MSEDQDIPTPPDGRCGDAPVYLLGLLDEPHRARFLEHAHACAVCRDELRSLRPAVDVLPATVPQLDAPPHVKRHVMTIVRAEARPAPAHAAPHEGAPERRHGFERGRAFERGAAFERTPRSERGPGWSRRLSRPAVTRRPVLALAVTVLLAGGIAIGTQFAPNDRAATRVVSADVTIAGASAQLHQSAGHNWLTVAGLPQPRPGRVYEVWVKHPGGPPQPTSSLFAPTTAGTATAAVPNDLGAASEVMVTQEPAGGSSLPTSAPVIVARVS